MRDIGKNIRDLDTLSFYVTWLARSAAPFFGFVEAGLSLLQPSGAEGTPQ